MRKVKIAIIGARDTEPSAISNMLFKITRVLDLCIKNNISVELRSGGASGVDDLIRLIGISGYYDDSINAIVYLPNSRKLKSVSNYPKKYIEFIVPEIDDVKRNIINELHPCPSALKHEYMYELHGRNLCILNGVDLNDPVDCVYYSAVPVGNGRVKGGTGMGIAYASKLKIPSFNEYVDEGDEFINYINNLIFALNKETIWKAQQN